MRERDKERKRERKKERERERKMRVDPRLRLLLFFVLNCQSIDQTTKFEIDLLTSKMKMRIPTEKRGAH